MLKFDVLNRFSDDVQFTAEIDCDENVSRSIRLGLAVEWALKTATNLRGSDLSGSDLSDSNLSYSNLRGSNLSYSNLSYSDLRGSDLSGSNLRGSNLRGSKWRDDITLDRQPLFIDGFVYRVIILDAHMKIGCELHRLSEWEAFDDRRIAEMDGTTSARFWREFKSPLLAMARAAGRS